MRKLFILLLGVILAGCNADAQVFSDSLTFTQPTTRADASALPLSEIAQYNARWGNLATGPFNVGSAVIPKGAGATVTWANSTRGEGQYCYVLQTLDTAGQLSVDSNVACSAFKCALGKKPDPATGLCAAIAKPNPPTGLTVS